MTVYRFICEACARPFEASKSTATTCSGACRQRRYAERKAANAVKAAAELLHRQTRAVIAYTATDDEAECQRLRAVLDDIAREAELAYPVDAAA